MLAILLLALLLLLPKVYATMQEPFTAQMKDANGVLSGVTGFAQAWQTVSVAGNTAFYVDLTSGSYFILDPSGATNLGNPLGVSVYFTSYVTEFPVDYWFSMKQNSGASLTSVVTAVSAYPLPSGDSIFQFPSGANDIAIYHVISGIEGSRNESGTSLYGISGVTIDN